MVCSASYGKVKVTAPDGSPIEMPSYDTGASGNHYGRARLGRLASDDSPHLQFIARAKGPGEDNAHRRRSGSGRDRSKPFLGDRHLHLRIGGSGWN